MTSSPEAVEARDAVVARLHQLFDHWGAERAVQFEGSWTAWGAIGELAGELAAALTAADVAPDASVAVVMRQRPALLAAELAALALGRPVVLVSPMSPDRALAADLAALAPAAVVLDGVDWARPGAMAAVEAAGTLGLVINDDLSLTVAGPTASPPPGPPFDGAVTVQTSGTTGPPTRHPVPWSALVALGGGLPGRPARSDKGALILSLPLVTLGGLLSVARLVFGGRPMSMMERFDVHVWAALVKEHRPTVIGAPPPVLSMILDADVSPEHFEGVTVYVTSSAAVPVEVARRFEARYGIPVLAVYGATEFLGSVTEWSPGRWAEFGPSKAGSAGRAAPGVRLRVVTADSLDDAEPREAAVGEAGILEVDPPRRAGHLPAGWLRTNDRARIDADGFLWVLGRADDVIVRGGFKVDLTTVEEAIRRHPLVIDAACVGLPDNRLGTVPGALVVLHPRAVLGVDDLRDHVREFVAPYAVPAVFRFTDHIPRTETLKPRRGRDPRPAHRVRPAAFSRCGLRSRPRARGRGRGRGCRGARSSVRPSGCRRSVVTPASRYLRMRSRTMSSVPRRFVCNTSSSGTSEAAPSRSPSSQRFWTAIGVLVVAGAAEGGVVEVVLLRAHRAEREGDPGPVPSPQELSTSSENATAPPTAMSTSANERPAFCAPRRMCSKKTSACSGMKRRAEPAVGDLARHSSDFGGRASRGRSGCPAAASRPMRIALPSPPGRGRRLISPSYSRLLAAARAAGRRRRLAQALGSGACSARRASPRRPAGR